MTCLRYLDAIDEPSRMTREQFEAAYAASSRVTVEWLYEQKLFPAVPCNCGEEFCGGWSVNRDNR